MQLAELAGEMQTMRWADAENTSGPGRALLEPTRPRLYVIDEPEQHLHPRLQRDAASWLADFVRQRPSQAVIATHAVPFFNLGSESRLVYLRRASGGTTVPQTMTPEALRRISDEARELGLTRGELLAITSVLLFVEGRADQRVLEALFGRELGRASRWSRCAVPLAPPALRRPRSCFASRPLRWRYGSTRCRRTSSVA
jgi:hypothetical protein